MRRRGYIYTHTHMRNELVFSFCPLNPFTMHWLAFRFMVEDTHPRCCCRVELNPKPHCCKTNVLTTQPSLHTNLCPVFSTGVKKRLIHTGFVCFHFTTQPCLGCFSFDKQADYLTPCLETGGDSFRAFSYRKLLLHIASDSGR